MFVEGDIDFPVVGGQLKNALLHVLTSDPSITTTGKIYFNNATKKVRVWNGTAWLEFGSSFTYSAGSGLYLDSNKAFHVNLGTPNISGLEFSSGGTLKLKVASSEFFLDGDGLSLEVGGVVNDHLYGEIDDSKLLQITTANKVAATAVEDKFLRNDGDDTTTGSITMETMVLMPQTSIPTVDEGRIYFDDISKYLKYWNGSSWRTIIDSVSVGVQSLSVNAPLVVSDDGMGHYLVQMPVATTAVSGYLSSTDWTTFNNKQNVISFEKGLLEVSADVVEASLTYVDVAAPGYCSFINSSDIVSCSGFIGNVYVGNWIKLVSDGTWYQVIDVISDTQIRIETQFAGITGSGVTTVRKFQGIGFSSATPSAKLQINLHDNNSIEIDANSGGLKTGNLFSGWQAIYNFDANWPQEHFALSAGGTWSIRDRSNLFDIILVDDEDGTVVNASVTLLNTIVSGDFEAMGNYAYLNAPDVKIQDLTLEVGYGSTGYPVNNASFSVLRGVENMVELRWNELTNKWEYTNDGVVYYELGAGQVSHFCQGFLGVTSVSVNHSLNDSLPVVQIYDDAGKIIKSHEIEIIDNNNLQIIFETVQTGFVSVIGGPVAGSIGARDKYSLVFSTLIVPFQVTIPSVLHNLGFTDEILVQVYNDNTPRDIITNTTGITIATNGNVVLTFAGPQNGKVLLAI